MGDLLMAYKSFYWRWECNNKVFLGLAVTNIERANGGDNARKSWRLKMRQNYNRGKLQEALIDFLKTGNLSRQLSRKEHVSP